jgi:hypothetical protein
VVTGESLAGQGLGIVQTPLFNQHARQNALEVQDDKMLRTEPANEPGARVHHAGPRTFSNDLAGDFNSAIVIFVADVRNRRGTLWDTETGHEAGTGSLAVIVSSWQ